MAVHNGVAYLAGQVPSDTTQDVAGQTAQVLAMVDALLARAGSDKTRILMAQVFLADVADFDAMNSAWGRLGRGRPGAAARDRRRPARPAGVEGGDRRDGGRVARLRG